MEYPSSMWDASLTGTQSKELEEIQWRAVRCVNNLRSPSDQTTNVSALIEIMNWTHLKDRRETRCHAMHFNEVATELPNYLTTQMSAAGYTKNHQMLYHTPYCNIAGSHMNSFFIKTTITWNQHNAGRSLLVGPPVVG